MRGELGEKGESPCVPFFLTPTIIKAFGKKDLLVKNIYFNNEKLWECLLTLYRTFETTHTHTRIMSFFMRNPLYMCLDTQKTLFGKNKRRKEEL